MVCLWWRDGEPRPRPLACTGFLPRSAARTCRYGSGYNLEAVQWGLWGEGGASGWGTWVVQGHLAPRRSPLKSCPEQHKAGFSGKKVKNIPPGGAEPAPSCSGLWSPTPHAEVSVTWRVWGIDGGTLAGSQGAARTGFLSKNSLAARQLGRASWGPQLAAPNESWGKQRQRGGPDNSLRRRPESGPSRPLTKSSHCWALVVEVLGADLTHHPGVHLLQDDAEGTLSGKAPGDRSTATSQPRPSPCTEELTPHPNGGRAPPAIGFHGPQAPDSHPCLCPAPWVTPPRQTTLEDTEVPTGAVCLNSPPSASRPARDSRSPLPQRPVTAIRLSHSARGMRRPYVRRLRPMSSHTGVVPARVKETHRAAPNPQGSALTWPLA